MWDGLFMLLALSTIMAVASFIAGILPLSLNLTPRQLRFISLLGTGVLVGTSLIVIIPEGIETMYSVGEGHGHGAVPAPVKMATVSKQQTGLKHPLEFSGVERSEAVDSSFPRVGAVKAPRDIIVKKTPELAAQWTGRRRTDKQKGKETEKLAEEKKIEPQRGGDDDSTEGHEEGHTRIHAPEPESEEVHEHDETPDPHAYIGVALILGFILMFLVDHLPGALASSKPQYKPLHISLSDLSRGPHAAVATPNLSASPPPERELAPPPKGSATTIGLIIHACADGIALGASSTAPSTSLSLIIFLAIMLHKAPAAFGLTAVLLKQGISKRTARTHLLFFSIAAPGGALFTWAVVHFLGRASLGGDDGLTWMTGWVLLFSGGTFLYVAMHSMVDAASSSHFHDEPTTNGFSSHGGKTALTKSDIATTLFGMLLPLVTQVGHVH
ncbi:Zinc/iron permease [Amniculicola lignicola CBS 123094]|uniref:Zinc/iron permease n=1 Tax=Amniculicola lignicola CBS 123094 TaxID=1392246 RepID=A0A6A5W5I0_9PLEO|nr:Zinc/iron permease [Amniculicola lignicola CBS 123094]